MFSLLFALIFNPNSLLAIAGLAAVAFGLYFLIGPVRLMKLALDIRTWCAIGLVLAFLAFAHAEKRADDLEKKIEAAVIQAQADEDAQDSLDRRADQRETRRTQDERIRTVIRDAPVGEKHDAALDQIAAEQAATQTSTPTPTGDQDALLDQRPQAPAPQAGGAAAVVVPAADGVRKQPDVDVVP